MLLKFILFVILFPSTFYCQKKPVPKTINSLKLTQSYQKKALWYQEIPHYNQDSSLYYYQKTLEVLLTQKPIPYFELGKLYLFKTNFIDRNYSLNTLDSLAKIGWYYLKQTQLNNEETRILKYDFLTNWAFIKLDNGKTKESINLFTKAMTYTKEHDAEKLQMKYLLNKGAFYDRYNLPEEQKMAFKLMKKANQYYQSLGVKKDPIALFKINRAFMNYYELKNHDSVYYYLNQIKSILPYTKKPSIHAWYYCAFGRELITNPLKNSDVISAKQYNEGKYNILTAIKIINSYRIKNSSINPYCSGLLGDIFLREKNYVEAIRSYKNSRDGYVQTDNRLGAIDMLLYMGTAYQQKGDLEKALLYKSQFYDESLTYQKEINERSLRENELQVNVLKQDKELSEKHNQLIIFIITITISLILLILVYRNFRLKQKSNLKLENINTELGNKNNLLDKRNAEIEVLMKEIHHRVKNNLEVVSSLLALQSAQLDDPNTKEAMAEGQNRVNSIGIVHQKLYQGTNLGAVEMKDYFLDLSESILDSFGAEERIELKLAMNTLDLDIDTAVPLGLIVNELLTNTIKYAFPKGEKGTITIKLEKQANNILHLEVADNGVGKSGIIHGTGFGGQLVSLLTNQLNGTMREENQNGTVLFFDFKLKKSA